MVEQTNFTYSALGRVFKKQTKTAEDQGKKPAEALQFFNPKQQLKSVKDLFPKNLFNTKAKDDMEKLKQKKKIIKEDEIYRTAD